MAGFQIRNKHGYALTMKELDFQAATLWGREVDPKYYASPKCKGYDEMSEIDKIRHDLNNWFDAIGWYIAESKEIAYPSEMSWNHVIAAMIGDSCCRYMMDQKTLNVYETPIIEGIQAIMDYYRPYIQLIQYWMNEGYTPHRV